MQAEQIGGLVKITGLKDIKSAVMRYALPNPKYTQAVAQKRNVYGLDKYVYFAQRQDDSVLIPVLCYKRYKPLDFPEVDFPKHGARLRDYQLRAVDEWVVRDHGILQACARSGKTIIGSEIIRRKRVRSVIVVPTKDIMHQWCDAAERFCNLQPHRLGGGYAEATEDSDLIVATYQSLVRKPERLRNCGLIIVDECHRTPCISIDKILGACPAKFRYGCTATPWRADGLHKALTWLLGGVKVVVERDEIRQHILDPEIEVVDSGFSFATKKDANLFQNLVAECEPRNKLIARLINDKVKNGYKVLTLAQRIDQLYDLAERNPKHTYAVIDGSTKKADRIAFLKAARDGELDCLYATYSLAGEGLDVPALSCLVYAAPNGNPTRTEQSCGRIARPHDGKNAPVVVDLRDGGPMPSRLWRSRCNTYKALGYNMSETVESHSLLD